MGLGTRSSEGRFSAYVEGLVSVIGHADRAKPLRDYCLGLLVPGERKSVEPMAAVTAGAGGGAAPVSAAFRRQCAVVGRAGPGSGARTGPAVVGAGGADRGLDHRRYGFPEEGPTLGRRDAAVLRATRQAGQLPDRGHAV